MSWHGLGGDGCRKIVELVFSPCGSIKSIWWELITDKSMLVGVELSTYSIDKEILKIIENQNIPQKKIERTFCKRFKRHRTAIAHAIKVQTKKAQSSPQELCAYFAPLRLTEKRAQPHYRNDNNFSIFLLISVF